jgi:hypothetical protein
VDFIERFLGVAPDGGDGSLEVSFIVLLVLIAIVICVTRTTNRKFKD